MVNFRISGQFYDYLVVGAGLYGAVFAREAAEHGKFVLVIDKRPHIGGNVYTEEIAGINVHKYGPHIFHTNDERVWSYVNRFAAFNDYVHEPKANFEGEIYSLPFNMNTFHEMWGVTTPAEAKAKIEAQGGRRGTLSEPANLEEQAISLVGRDIYVKLVKGYTEKQWGRKCTELPAFIIRRLPVRFTYDNNYFNAKYQGIPVGGYTKMVSAILDHPNIEVRLGVDYLATDGAGPGGSSVGTAGAGPGGLSVGAAGPTVREQLNAQAEQVVYTGPIDAYFDYRLGHLEYRSLRFETEVVNSPDYQGHAVVNYTDAETPWTRIIEHKWFERERFAQIPAGTENEQTVITREFSSKWKPGEEPYYPVNDEKNDRLYAEYRKLADEENARLAALAHYQTACGQAAGRPERVIFGGRLGEYRYYDMDQVIAAALETAEHLLLK